ncbi:PqqD family protein [Isoptericola sp. AK164]|uniref:PqqD family protein n=1 Tax=Isoptericola sp. AK164 TaxID=3024246 RepID=UPI002418302B|nr:PqqD family protein [Isoptericola sp. AK164]
MRLRTDGVTWQEIDGELVLLDLASSAYLTTNRAGTLLAQALVDGADTGELATALVEEFDIDEERARHDAAAFVDELRRRSLLVE